MDTRQQIHEDLIDFLSKYERFKDGNGKSLFLKSKKECYSHEVQGLDSNQINLATIVFLDVLNIHSGSASNYNLYELLKAYLKLPDCRDAINEIVNEARRNRHK